MGLLEELDIPDTETLTDKNEMSVGIKSLISAQGKSSDTISKTYSNKNKKLILSYLRNENFTLVVDDFHYMPPDVQREVVRSLKSEVFEGLVAILIAVPHRAFDAIGVEREMEGRFANVQIPSWRNQELIEISRIGFAELKMDVPQECQQDFARESYGSPLLMQRFCNRLCVHYEVDESLDLMKNYNPSDQIKHSIYKYVSAQFGFPTFEKLSKGPQSRSKRMDRKLIGGSEVLDIYQSVLRAIASTGPKEKIPYNEIREALASILVAENIPQKHEISSALGHMSGIAKDEIEGEPVLEWVDDFLYITDPFLMFYMRWSQRERA